MIEHPRYWPSVPSAEHLRRTVAWATSSAADGFPVEVDGDDLARITGDLSRLVTIYDWRPRA